MDCELLITGSEPGLLPCNFTSQLLAIEVLAADRMPTWFKSGWLSSTTIIDGVTHQGKRFQLGFGHQLIEIPYLNYQLTFEPVNWVPITLIKIKELSTNQARTILMPLYAPLPGTMADQPVLDSLPSSFAAPQYLVATPPASYQALAANPARQKFSITNIGTAAVFIDLDAPAALTKRFASIPVGGTYISDFDYAGAVFVWSTNAASQAVEVRELVQ
jgi:hypothetical protein